MKLKIPFILVAIFIIFIGCAKHKEGTIGFYTTAQITAPVKIYVNEQYKAQVIYSLNYSPDCNDPYVVKITMPEGSYRVTAITGNTQVNYKINWKRNTCITFNL